MWPNISGDVGYYQNFGMLYSDTTRISGVFYKNVETTRCIAGTAQASFSLGFDASRSNGLYGDSSMVQPKSLSVIYLIKS